MKWGYDHRVKETFWKAIKNRLVIKEQYFLKSLDYLPEIKHVDYYMQNNHSWVCVPQSCFYYLLLCLNGSRLESLKLNI